MDEDYLLTIIRKQGEQIAMLAKSQMLVAESLERLRQRVQLLEAGEAIMQMREDRVVN